MKTKKRIALFIAALALTATVVLSSVAFVGCGGEKITLVGSTSMEELMGVLITEYQKTNDVEIEMTCNGSGEGIEAAQDGSCTFGMASRDLKDDETGVTQQTIAIDGIAVITQTTTGANNATLAQLYDLYASNVSFTDNGVEIDTAVGRETGSGTRSAFDELVKKDGAELGKANEGKGYNSAVSLQTSTNNVLNSVKSAKTPAVGYISLGSVTEDVKALKIEGVEATNENIKADKYALKRNFNLILPEDGVDALSETAKDFYDFIMGEEGQKIIADEGYLSVSE